MRELNLGRSVSRAGEFKTSVSWERVVGVLTAISVIYLVGTPIIMLLFSSVRATKDRLPFEVTSFTLDNYRVVFTSETTYRLLLSTLGYAIGTVALGLGLAMVFAYLIERTNIPLRSVVLVLVLSPMALPPFVAGIAWVLLANPRNGLMNVVLRGVSGSSGEGPLNVYSIAGMILVTAIMFVPSIYVMVSGTFARMDPALEDAGRVAGAGTWTTLRHITVPLLRPGIVGAAIYYFVISVELFEIPALLGIPSGNHLLSTWIFYLVHRPGNLPDYGLASAYGMLIMIVATVLILYYGRMTRHANRYATVTGRGYRPTLIDLGQWKYVLFATIVLYFIITVVLPFAVLVWKSIVAPYAPISLEALATANLRNYARAISSPKTIDAARNSAVIALTTAFAAITLSTLVAWLSIRSRSWGSTLPDRLTFVAAGIPSIVVALAVMFVYLSIPLPIYATIWIIVIALTTRYISYGARVMSAAYLQIHRELEEAAWTSGASWRSTMAKVVLPLLWPGFLRGWLWMFVHALRDATIALMLVAVGNETIAARLWFVWFDDADLPYASALSVMLMLVSAAFTYFVARQTLQMGEEKHPEQL